MRDILLVCFLFVAIFYAFKRPYLGVAAWLWIALTGPTQWAFGFSQSFRLNFTIVVVTAIAWVFAGKKYKPQGSSIHFWVLIFWLWMLISTLFHDQIDSDFVWEKMTEFTKVIALYVFIILTVQRKHEIETLIWAIVLAVSAYAGMEAVKFLLSLGGHRIIGRVGILADRNDLAVAINMCIPLLIYLWAQTKNKMLKLSLVGLIVLNAIAIVGTYSRGGFIGLIILGIAFWLKSNRKGVLLILALISLPVAYQFAPQDWRDRQQTVETAALEDSSFIGRLWAWKIATLIAIDDPITGGGFKATTDPALWNQYALLTPDFGPIETPPIPEFMPPKAAHNIYFQVLSSAGFVGLLIFLKLLWNGFFKCWKLSSETDKLGVNWRSDLSKMMVLVFFGYGVTGLNVSLAYFELLYGLLAITAIVYSQKDQQA